MRYLAGTIQISESADLPILRTAYRAGHLTVHQMYESVHAGDVKRARWNTFKWRVQRLVEHRFLDGSRVAGLGLVLSLGRDGEFYLQGREPSVVERASRTGAGNRRDQVWHDTDLYDAYLRLRRAGIVTGWQHEAEIHAENEFSTFRYKKDYDAIVTFTIAGITADVALEYERTAKSTAEYERICGDIDDETRVSRFLYLARSLQLQSFLAHGFRGTTRNFYITTFHEFSTNPMQAQLIDVRRGVLTCLEHCLNIPE